MTEADLVKLVRSSLMQLTLHEVPCGRVNPLSGPYEVPGKPGLEHYWAYRISSKKNLIQFAGSVERTLCFQYSADNKKTTIGAEIVLSFFLQSHKLHGSFCYEPHLIQRTLGTNRAETSSCSFLNVYNIHGFEDGGIFPGSFKTQPWTYLNDEARNHWMDAVCSDLAAASPSAKEFTEYILNKRTNMAREFKFFRTLSQFASPAGIP